MAAESLFVLNSCSGLAHHIYVLLRSSRFFAVVPRLLIRQDSVFFEDHLGHKRQLDYMWAQYFDVSGIV